MTRESDPYTGHASRMSSATPVAFWSAMSMTTTSASCLSATPRATVAPTLPAPPTTVTLRFIVAPSRDGLPRSHEEREGTHEEIGVQKRHFVRLRVLRVFVAGSRWLHLFDHDVGE